MLQDSPHAFPDKLKVAIQSLLPRMMAIMRTADSLCALISRSEGLAKLPTPSTACAVFMLAVEAELQKQVPGWKAPKNSEVVVVESDSDDGKPMASRKGAFDDFRGSPFVRSGTGG